MERMLSRRCYRSRYLLACEPSARSRLMARSVMNVASEVTAITASWYHKSRLPRVPRPYARALSHAYSCVAARVRTTRARALLSIRPRGCSATTRGVAVHEDYRLGENKTAEIFRRDYRLDSYGFSAKFFTLTCRPRARPLVASRN